MNESVVALAAAPAAPVPQADRTASPRANADSLETLLRECFRPPPLDSGSGVAALPGARAPFAVRMTAEQVLAVAEDADVRAEILDDVANRYGNRRAQPSSGRIFRDGGDRRVADLREVAADLRRIAANLVDH